MRFKKETKSVVITLGIVFGFWFVSVGAMAMSPPPMNPPSCPTGEPGCDYPLHTRSQAQVKSGKLELNGVFQANSSTYLAVSSGSVGIGTDSPQAKLDVVGNEVRVGSSGTACTGANEGSIRYSNGQFYGCADGSWTTLYLY